MKTTLEMPDELFRRAKATAAKRGQSLKQLVTIAVERELATPSAEVGISNQRQAAVDASLHELESLSQRISAAWPQGVNAVEAIRDQRRDL